MPRRIRVDFSVPSAGECDICHQASSSLVRRYLTKNYGLNYKGAWDHPLSPYYRVKEDWLPVHPQPGGIGYRHWLAWVCGFRSEKELRRARAVENFLRFRRRTSSQLRLWAFGYDMDNMKARCWYESALPLYGFADCSAEVQHGIELDVTLWLAGAELAALCLRTAVKDAWFSGESRGDFSAIDASFWSATEPAFYDHLGRLIELRGSGADSAPLQLLEAWHRLLVKTATELFDGYFVGAGPVERQNPRRVAHAYQRLARTLRGPKMRKALGLPSSPSDHFAHAP
jgi:CRISPR system Cascade subunit CasA